MWPLSLHLSLTWKRASRPDYSHVQVQAARREAMRKGVAGASLRNSLRAGTWQMSSKRAGTTTTERLPLPATSLAWESRMWMNKCAGRISVKPYASHAFERFYLFTLYLTFIAQHTFLRSCIHRWAAFPALNRLYVDEIGGALRARGRTPGGSAATFDVVDVQVQYQYHIVHGR